MISTSASAASADLYPSLLPPQPTMHADSPRPRGGSGNLLEVPYHNVHLPGISQDLGRRIHDTSKPCESISNKSEEEPMEASQKRKREDDSVLDLEKHHRASGVILEQNDTSTAANTIVSTIQYDVKNSSTGVKEKRLKMDGSSPQCFALPAQLWQHIFCFVPPVFLGRLLRVNHAFHDHLTQGDTREDLCALPNSTVQPMKAESIWLASRRRFCPGLPRPLQDLTELAMWRLLRGSSCQKCGKANASISPSNAENPLESGPGENGVRIIWPFGVRACGPCLKVASKTVSVPASALV